MSEAHYQPRHGEVGSWVRLADGTLGQVWALSPTGRAKVYVAKVSDLRPPHDDTQEALL